MGLRQIGRHLRWFPINMVSKNPATSGRNRVLPRGSKYPIFKGSGPKGHGGSVLGTRVLNQFGPPGAPVFCQSPCYNPQMPPTSPSVSIGSVLENSGSGDPEEVWLWESAPPWNMEHPEGDEKASTRRLLCSSVLVMTHFLLRDYTMLPIRDSI